MKLFLYRCIMFLVKPLVRLILFIRRVDSLETKVAKRKKERFGYSSVKRPEGRLFWINAASVGESNSVIPVINEILKAYPDVSVLMTTTTVTSADIMAKKLDGKRVFHQFLPVDRRAYVDRFFKFWKPDLGFFVDSDFWPNLILSAKSNKIPLILLNGRISDKSFAKYKNNLSFLRPLVAAFIYAFGKSEEDKHRLEVMGFSPVVCVGNLKYGLPPLPFDKEELKQLKKDVGNRPVWVVASTHPGEEEIVLAAHISIKRKYSDLLMVLAPRHPLRGGEIKELVEANDLKAVLRSKKGKITETTDIYIADTMGELGLFYSLANVVFIGGSFVDVGGHNPMEPARLHNVILSGKTIYNFKETYEILENEKCVIIVNDENDLADKVRSFLGYPDTMKQYMDRAFFVAEREADVLDRTMEMLKPVLDVKKND